MGKRPFYKDEKLMIRLGLIFMFVLVIALLLPKSYLRMYHYEVGKPWQESDLKAPFDFPLYKSANEIEEEKRMAAARVKPVFVYDSVRANLSKQSAIDWLNTYMKLVDEYRTEVREDPASAAKMRQDIFGETYGINPDKLIERVSRPESWESSMLTAASDLMTRLYEKGVIDSAKANINQDILTLRITDHEEMMVPKSILLNVSDLGDFIQERTEGLAPQDRKILRRMAQENLVPNYYYSDSLTKIDEQKAVEAVSPVYGKVKADELIIEKGGIVTNEVDRKIRSLIRKQEERAGTRTFLRRFSGQFIALTILTLILILYLQNNRPRIYYRNRKFALVLLIFFFMMMLVILSQIMGRVLQQQFDIKLIFLAPLCMVPILITAFFDYKFGFISNIFIALFTGLVVINGFEIMFIQACAGTVAVYSLQRLRNRGDFFLSLSFILFTYIFAFVGYSFFVKGSFQEINYQNLILFLINVALTITTYPLIYVFEKTFRITSDLTYVELLDTNHPLLKELSLRAPGTFQHSLQVSNIAEAVVNRIGGNSLQTRVGALFHDVGKMNNPKFFIENTKDGVNPHDNLTPLQSAKIIIQHVPEGADLARQHNLPPEIIDFIKTHHGTTRVEYFYRKFMEENPEGDQQEDKFRYPGPLPNTREQAVLMIADSIEATCRSLKNPNPQELKQVVERTISTKIAQEQLKNANITFRDLEDIKEVVYNQLVSIYHGRIEYPDDEKPKG